LSTEAVLQFRTEAAWEPVYDTAKITDELNAQLLRLGGGMSTLGPDPQLGGGYYLWVANGELEIEGSSLPRWSMVFVDRLEAAPKIQAGRKGLEVLVMQFPKDDD
jgi:hypothetical protein